ncbi:MAG: DUF2267 domain-containing protein [Flavobacteriaceae bacterium]|nr:DUF2267 domain-containing protein [Flavobacteriaceae bacterium]
MAHDFTKFALEGNKFLKDYTAELNLGEDTDKAYRILTAILHAFRGMISFQESVQLISQFPMFLKAVYVNRWDTKQNKTKPKNTEQFIALVREKCGNTAAIDFPDDDISEMYFSVTFISLRKYISFGELEDLKSNLPKDLKWMVGGTLLF